MKIRHHVVGPQMIQNAFQHPQRCVNMLLLHVSRGNVNDRWSPTLSHGTKNPTNIWFLSSVGNSTIGIPRSNDCKVVTSIYQLQLRSEVIEHPGTQAYFCFFSGTMPCWCVKMVFCPFPLKEHKYSVSVEFKGKDIILDHVIEFIETTCRQTASSNFISSFHI